MNFKLRLLAMLLLVMMVFTSCSIDSLLKYIPGWGGNSTTATTPTASTEPTTPTDSTSSTEPEGPETPSNLIDIASFTRKANSMQKSELLAMYTLTQEEIDATLDLLDQMVAGALPDPEGDPNVAVMTMEEWDVLYQQFEDAFYHIAQQMTVATIIYYCNMTDEAATERHLNTQDMFYDVQDKYNQSLRELYLNSPMKDELFEGWTEQEIQEMLEYDPTVMEVKKVIDDLEVQFDNLDDNDYGFSDASVELYKQLIVERRKIAAFAGYDNYYDYAAKNVYGREYSAEDLAVFREYLVNYIVPEFEGIYDKFNAWRDLSSKRQETFINFVNEAFDSKNSSKNYLLLYLNSIEGSMGEYMRSVFTDKNCIFSNNTNSHPTAFCTYMYEDEKPFCLFGINGQSANTVVHEIGHYYADMANSDLRSYDLLETHSQGNEFLFIKFCEDEMNAAVYDCVRAYNLLNACYVMIVATLVDEFEQRVYALSDEEIMAMTGDDFDAIMADVCEPYGGVDWVTDNISDPYDYWRQVAISNPVYYISYAVSAAAAVEIFALAEEDIAAAHEAYKTLVEGVTEEDGFVIALGKAGLYTPFEEDAFKLIAKTLKK